MVKLVNGEAITFEFSKLKEPASKKQAAAAKVRVLPFSEYTSNDTKQKNENILVRFRNKDGYEVGRLVNEHASWVAKLLNMGVVMLEGSIADIAAKYSTGSLAPLCAKRLFYSRRIQKQAANVFCRSLP